MRNCHAHRVSNTAEGGDYPAGIQVVMHGMVSTQPRHEPYAEEEDEGTRAHLRSMWRYMVETANKHYEPGVFTTFVGDEWSATPNGANLHRNVIFRTDDVPEEPLSYFDTQNPEELWRWMQEVGDPILEGPLVTPYYEKAIEDYHRFQRQKR